ncbi:hypothetical protein FRC18_002487, partial [Serendipita sp. 400]
MSSYQPNQVPPADNAISSQNVRGRGRGRGRGRRLQNDENDSSMSRVKARVVPKRPEPNRVATWNGPGG